MSKESQMRVKYGATKGGLARGDGDHPEPSEGDVHAKGGLSKEAQVLTISLTFIMSNHLISKITICMLQCFISVW